MYMCLRESSNDEEGTTLEIQADSKTSKMLRAEDLFGVELLDNIEGTMNVALGYPVLELSKYILRCAHRMLYVNKI